MPSQTTDTIERDSNTTDLGSSTSSSGRTQSTKEPPSWSELASKATGGSVGKAGSKLTGRTVGYIAAALTLGFGTSLLPFLSFSIPGGWFMTMFLVSLVGSLIGKGDYISSGLAGAALTGTMSLLTGVLVAFTTLGLSVAFAALFGAVAGVAGTALGKYIRN